MHTRPPGGLGTYRLSEKESIQLGGVDASSKRLIRHKTCTSAIFFFRPCVCHLTAVVGSFRNGRLLTYSIFSLFKLEVKEVQAFHADVNPEDSTSEGLADLVATILIRGCGNDKLSPCKVHAGDVPRG